jgi:hypothetical protein
VEADCKAALKASEEQAHKSQMAQDLLARMNILEEVEDKDLPHSVSPTLISQN